MEHEYDKMIGKKVLAIHAIDNTHAQAWIFGRGEFLGTFYPDSAVGALADHIREVDGDDARNPKIRLDDGNIIWGCECWWMDVYRGDMWLMEMASHGYEVLDVDINDVRIRYLEDHDG